MADKLAKIGANSDIVAIFGTDVNLQERPDFIPEGDRTGTEGITSEDIRLPRLGIAQGLSPQLTPGNGEFIDDLRMFDMFNDNTKQVYGKGPVFFVVVRRDVRCIEFKPRTEGGGVVDLNVPRHDPRATQWREVDGKRLPPPATTFHEFIVLLLNRDRDPEPIVISVKTTNKHNRKAITDLNGFILKRASQGALSVPIYGVIYSVESTSAKNGDYTFGVPVFKEVGYIPKSMPELFQRAKDYAESLEGKTIVVDREPGDEDVDFQPSVIEGQVAPTM